MFRSKRFKPIIRLISVLVLSVFVFNDTLKAQNLTPAIAKPQLLESLQLSNHLGSIKEIFLSAKKKQSLPSIIHIQDSHANYEAQKQIFEILRQITNNPSFNLPVVIAVEAAAGPLNPKKIFGDENKEFQNAFSDVLLKKGYLTGVEKFALETAKDVRLIGVEEPKLYRKNLKSFQAAHQIKQAYLPLLKNAEAALVRLQKEIYSEQLFKLSEKLKLYLNGGLSFKQFLHYLMSFNPDLLDYPQIEKTLNLLNLEEQIDYSKIQKERRVLLNELEKKLPAEDYQLLVEKNLLFQLGQLSPLNYYRFVEHMVNSHYMAPEAVLGRFPGLFKYIQTLEAHQDIQGPELYKETESLTRELRMKLILTESEKSLEKLNEYFSYLEKLMSLEMSRQDLKQFLKLDNSLIKWVEVLRGIENSSELITQLQRMNGLFPQLPKLTEFYDLAFQRDQVMSQNLMKLAQKEKDSLIFFISGGFHTEGISRELENNNISYAVISPRLISYNPDAYLRQILNIRTPFEQALLRAGNRLGIELLSVNQPMTPAVREKKTIVKIKQVLTKAGLVAAALRGNSGLYERVSSLLKRRLDGVGEVRILKIAFLPYNKITYGVVQINDEVFTFFHSFQLSERLFNQLAGNMERELSIFDVYLATGDISELLENEVGDRRLMTHRGKSSNEPLPTSGLAKYEAGVEEGDFPEKRNPDQRQRRIIIDAQTQLVKSLDKKYGTYTPVYQQLSQKLFIPEFYLVDPKVIGSAAVTLQNAIIFEDVYFEELVDEKAREGQILFIRLLLRGELPHIDIGEERNINNKRLEQEIVALIDQLDEYLSLQESEKNKLKRYQQALTEKEGVAARLPETNMAEFFQLAQELDETVKKSKTSWSDLSRSQKVDFLQKPAEEFVVDHFPELRKGVVNKLVLAKNMVRLNPFGEFEQKAKYILVISSNGTILSVKKEGDEIPGGYDSVQITFEKKKKKNPKFYLVPHSMRGKSSEARANLKETVQLLNQVIDESFSLEQVREKIHSKDISIEEFVQAILAYPLSDQESVKSFLELVGFFSDKELGIINEKYYELFRKALKLKFTQIRGIELENVESAKQVYRRLQYTERDRLLASQHLLPAINREIIGTYLNENISQEVEQGDVFQIGENNFYLVLSMEEGNLRLIEYAIDEKNNRGKVQALNYYLEEGQTVKMGTRDSNGNSLKVKGKGIFKDHIQIERKNGALVLTPLRKTAQVAVYSSVNQLLDESEATIDIISRGIRNLFPDEFPQPLPAAHVDLARISHGTVDRLRLFSEVKRFVPSGMPAKDYKTNGSVWAGWRGGNYDTTPIQGWKIHVAATLDLETDERVMTLVTDYLRSRKIEHKVHRVDKIEEHVEAETYRQGGPRQSIKLITVYPHSRDQAIQFAAEMEFLIQREKLGMRPKKIQGEKTLIKNGFVHFRYGKMKTIDFFDAGFLINPKNPGERVLDNRDKYEPLPSWVTDIQEEVNGFYQELMKKRKTSRSRLRTETQLFLRQSQESSSTEDIRLVDLLEYEVSLVERLSLLDSLLQSKRLSVLEKVESYQAKIKETLEVINKIRLKMAGVEDIDSILLRNIRKLREFQERAAAETLDESIMGKLVLDKKGKIFDIKLLKENFKDEVFARVAGQTLFEVNFIWNPSKPYQKWQFSNGLPANLEAIADEIARTLNQQDQSEGSAVFSAVPDWKKLSFDELLQKHMMEAWKGMTSPSLDNSSLRKNLIEVMGKFRTVYHKAPEYFYHLLKNHFGKEFIFEYEQERVQANDRFMKNFILNYLRVILAVDSGQILDGLDPKNILNVRKYFYRLYGNFNEEPFNAQEISPENIYIGEIGHEMKAQSEDSKDLVIYSAYELYSYSRGASRYFITVRYKGRKMVFMRSASHQIWRRVEVMIPGWIAKPLAEHALDLNQQLNNRLDEIILGPSRLLHPVELEDGDQLEEIMQKEGILFTVSSLIDRDDFNFNRYNFYVELGRDEENRLQPQLVESWFRENKEALRNWGDGANTQDGAVYFAKVLPAPQPFTGIELEKTMDGTRVKQMYQTIPATFIEVDPSEKMILIGDHTYLKFLIKKNKVILIPEDPSGDLVEQVLKPGEYNLGRALKRENLKDINIIFPDETISAKHLTLKIEAVDGKIKIFAADLDSKNGSFLLDLDRPIVEKTPVKPTDEELAEEIQDKTAHFNVVNLREAVLDEPSLLNEELDLVNSENEHVNKLAKSLLQQVNAPDSLDLQKQILAYVLIMHVGSKNAIKRASQILISDQPLSEWGYALTPKMLLYLSEARFIHYEKFRSLRSRLQLYHATKLWKKDQEFDDSEYEARKIRFIEINETIKQMSTVLWNAREKRREFPREPAVQPEPPESSVLERADLLIDLSKHDELIESLIQAYRAFDVEKFRVVLKNVLALDPNEIRLVLQRVLEKISENKTSFLMFALVLLSHQAYSKDFMDESKDVDISSLAHSTPFMEEWVRVFFADLISELKKIRFPKEVENPDEIKSELIADVEEIQQVILAKGDILKILESLKKDVKPFFLDLKKLNYLKKQFYPELDELEEKPIDLGLMIRSELIEQILGVLNKIAVTEIILELLKASENQNIEEPQLGEAAETQASVTPAPSGSDDLDESDLLNALTGGGETPIVMMDSAEAAQAGLYEGEAESDPEEEEWIRQIADRLDVSPLDEEDGDSPLILDDPLEEGSVGRGQTPAPLPASAPSPAPAPAASEPADSPAVLEIHGVNSAEADWPSDSAVDRLMHEQGLDQIGETGVASEVSASTGVSGDQDDSEKGYAVYLSKIAEYVRNIDFNRAKTFLTQLPWRLIVAFILSVSILAALIFLIPTSKETSKKEDNEPVPTEPESTPGHVDSRTHTETPQRTEPVPQPRTEPTQPEQIEHPRSTQPTPVERPQPPKAEDYLDIKLAALNQGIGNIEAAFIVSLRIGFGEEYAATYVSIRRNPIEAFREMVRRNEERLSAAQNDSDRNLAALQNHLDFELFRLYLEKVNKYRRTAALRFAQANPDYKEMRQFTDVAPLLGSIKRIQDSSRYSQLAGVNPSLELTPALEQNADYSAFLSRFQKVSRYVGLFGEENEKQRMYVQIRTIYRSSFSNGSTFIPSTFTKYQFDLIYFFTKRSLRPLLERVNNADRLNRAQKVELRAQLIETAQNIEFLIRVQAVAPWLPEEENASTLNVTAGMFRQFAESLPQGSDEEGQRKMGQTGEESFIFPLIPIEPEDPLAALKRVLTKIYAQYENENETSELISILKPVLSCLPAEVSLEYRESADNIRKLMGGEFTELTLSHLTHDELTLLEKKVSEIEIDAKDARAWNAFLTQKREIESSLKASLKEDLAKYHLILKLDSAHANKAQVLRVKTKMTSAAYQTPLGHSGIHVETMGAFLKIELGGETSFELNLKIEALIRLLQTLRDQPKPRSGFDQLDPPARMKAVETAA